jgi:ribokinase
MQKNVCILGSINMDLVLRVNRMVKPGETILSKDFKKVSGGKGANQAVAAKRLGANVSFIGMIGMDDNGSEILKAFKEDKIDVSHIKVSKSNPTGMAIITVDDDGKNSIVVVPGANMKIDSDSIEEAKDVIKESKILIAQFETTVEATIEAFKVAKENKVITILNPAPAREIPEELLKLTDIIAPNETEVFELTDIKVDDTDKIREAADKLIEKGVKFVIITLGERGAALVSKEKLIIVPAYKVKAIDTTAAGDSFIGALASKLQNEDEIGFENIQKAIKFANKVSSIVVQKQGAQPSLPYLEEVLKVYKEE